MAFSLEHLDPSSGQAFWEALAHIPGCPVPVIEPMTGEMVFESNAVFKLPGVLLGAGLAPGSPLLVVMGPTPMRRGPQALKPLVLETLRGAGWEVQPLLLEPDAGGQVHTDLEQIGRVRQRLGPGMGVVSIGSGTVSDIVKYACLEHDRSCGDRIGYVAVPTANSVGAYLSNRSSVFVQGVKQSLPSRLPDALVFDLETLRDAPLAMTIAGIGDMLVGSISLPDWILADRLGLDPTFSEFMPTLLAPMAQVFSAHAARIRGGDLASVAVQARLMSCLSIGSSVLGASTPGSGYEHVLSHVLDMVAVRNGRPPAVHGIQVILATLLLLQAYREFLASFRPDRLDPRACFPSPPEMQDRIRSAYADLDPSGGIADQCWSEYRQKLEAWRGQQAALSGVLGEWARLRRQLESRMEPASRLARILADLGAPLEFAELDPPVTREQVRFAFLNAPFIRRRLTLGDLLVFFGWDRPALFEAAWDRSLAAAAAARR